jgi:hypothetical protein
LAEAQAGAAVKHKQASSLLKQLHLSQLDLSQPSTERESVRDRACALPEAAQAQPAVNPPLLYMAELTATKVLAYSCKPTRKIPVGSVLVVV